LFFSEPMYEAARTAVKGQLSNSEGKGGVASKPRPLSNDGKCTWYVLSFPQYICPRRRDDRRIGSTPHRW
jgi:hypothetical protein